MNFTEYINNAKMPDGFTSTGIDKSFYLDIMECVINAYDDENLTKRCREYADSIVDNIQSFSRITMTLLILVCNGRRKESAELAYEMMDVCCRDLSRTVKNNRNDFAVKEIMLAFKAAKHCVSPERVALWRDNLALIDPYVNYFYTNDNHSLLHNINIYNMAGEYLRESEGLTDTNEYFAQHWDIQLGKFDENGMYIDPNAPFVYDLTTRVQIQLITGMGYRGRYFEAIDKMLKKGSIMTLFMQSAAFQFPFGGRSNQYQFNEALIAANCEYEAVRYKNLGDMKTAGMFKRAGHLAISSVKRWIDVSPPHHIKNFYPIDSGAGIDSYGTYDVYMATLASFIYIAYIFADDSITEYACPAELGGFAFETSKVFHKLFVNCSGYSMQFDTAPDYKYDSRGLGRIHKRGIPTELAISVPFTATPLYKLLEGMTSSDIAISPGITDDSGNVLYLSDSAADIEIKYQLLKQSPSELIFTLSYLQNQRVSVMEQYTVNSDGIKIKCTAAKESCPLYYRLPLFVENGLQRSDIIYDSEINTICVKLDKYEYEIQLQSETPFTINSELYANKNGMYKTVVARSSTENIEFLLSLTGG